MAVKPRRWRGKPHRPRQVAVVLRGGPASALSLHLLLEGVCDFLSPRRGHHQHDARAAAHDQAQRARGVCHPHGILGVCEKMQGQAGREG